MNRQSAPPLHVQALRKAPRTKPTSAAAPGPTLAPVRPAQAASRAAPPVAVSASRGPQPLRVTFHGPSQPLCFGGRNVSLAPGIGNRLADKIKPPTGMQQVGDCTRNRSHRQPFDHGHFIIQKFIAMKDDWPRQRPPKPCSLRNRQMNRGRICVGDAVHGQSGFVR